MASRYAYVLRTCAADGTSHHGNFTWPKKGEVACPDWDPSPRCGGGLHGLLDGLGDGGLLDWSDDAIWQVVRVARSEVVDIDGSKVKFPKGTVVVSGTRQEAVDYMVAKGLAGVPASTVTAGYHGTATAGYRGTATAGDHGTATAGDCGTATAGEDGVIAIPRWDGKRFTMHIAEVGGEGLEPNVAYRLDGDGNFVKAEA